ncbi:MAG: hypothetical protein J5I57_08560 [Melioribacteraceae bacterium]|nr:hypothetical protein [Melioribacteraceae bacterium]
MNDETRRVLAFISAALINKEDYDSLFDHTNSKSFNYSIEFSGNNFVAHDFDLDCDVEGELHNNVYKIYHYGLRNFIDLSINGFEFSGCDNKSKHKFSGKVVNQNVQFFDEENSSRFLYNV